MYNVRKVFVTLALLQVIALAKCYDRACSQTEYNRCVRIADPLVKEAHLIFPDNLDDIDVVCRTWDRFVDCLKTYTDKCFTPEQRRQFNKAVENPIQSVHQMCLQPSYQKEYLKHAPCIKSTITERQHCGSQYNLLVDQVAQGDDTSRAALCCSHDRFKQCVARESRRLCDGGAPNGPAARFTNQIIEKALSFLQDQCYNYIPNSGDCLTYTIGEGRITDPVISTSSSEVYPWSTIQDGGAKELPPSRMTPPKAVSPWLPSASVSVQSTPDTGLPPTDFLGSRSRPGAYGRSSWSDSPSQNTQPGVNTVQLFSDSPPTATSRPEWATMSTWHVLNRSPDHSAVGGSGIAGDADDDPYKKPYPSTYETSYNSYGSTSDSSLLTSTETWYPAAGNQIGNEVDEPNQQGLTKPKNAARKTTQRFVVIAMVVSFTFYRCVYI